MSGSQGPGCCNVELCEGVYDQLVRKIAGLANGIRLAGDDWHCNCDLLSSDSASAR